MQQVVAVEAVHHVYVVPVVPQSVSQPVEVDRVTAEAPWRVERGQVQEIERAHHESRGCAPLYREGAPLDKELA